MKHEPPVYQIKTTSHDLKAEKFALGVDHKAETTKQAQKADGKTPMQQETRNEKPAKQTRGNNHLNESDDPFHFHDIIQSLDDSDGGEKAHPKRAPLQSQFANMHFEEKNSAIVESILTNVDEEFGPSYRKNANFKEYARQ